ncbi:phage recombination protein Bet [Pseudomethylobacillus aquaticus]|uniref:Phage recombination protein Bet n=1 Tax=Pseudomethylobacillus aquaticus TaxID=2676064 RepID=A0A3N0V5C7_9PROT|nr:phage recombination protein Bet [Pseudomethylobacillus aquaticus]ROH87969.1 phage recombination protein Bet [Pseudomethylobacillus aquaticus]
MSSTELAKVNKAPVPALQMSEDDLIKVLQDSVYPGAQVNSIKMVINVCRAAGKDPLKKPYHIVPMPVATGEKDRNGWDIKKMRDVIMPGINDYRTDAARTGQHAGSSEPEFGPDVTETLDGVSITYPLWCRVAVKRRMPSGEIVEFTAKELWKENYASKSKESSAPNAMWKKRPYAQLAKCAEAQALRKGFPEVGSQPTADEMEGKEIDVTEEATALQKTEYYSDDEFLTNKPAWKKTVDNGKDPGRFINFIESKGKLFSEKQKAEIAGWQAVDKSVEVLPPVDDGWVAELEANEPGAQG